MKNRRNYYRILHVQRDAPPAVIRSSYRTMMQKMKMHPDLGGDHQDAALVNEAFAVLNDPEMRKAYDEALAGLHPPASHDQRPAEQPVDADAYCEETAEPGNADEQCLFCLARCRPSQLRQPEDVCPGCGGPLYPAEEVRFDGDRQRAVDRIPKRTRASIAIRSAKTSRYEGWVQDISLNGMQLRAESVLSEGQVILVTTDVLDAIARVVGIQRAPADTEAHPGHAAPWRVGLRFLTLRFHRTRGSFVSIDI